MLRGVLSMLLGVLLGVFLGRLLRGFRLRWLLLLLLRFFGPKCGLVSQRFKPSPARAGTEVWPLRFSGSGPSLETPTRIEH